ncbi:MAG: hypothetical protein J3Q66DRAFT_321536 [Benniella sp.]|nr:MAG: hypothetical protein J3Q66DRAFT_321536 [Benniella sp.]
MECTNDGQTELLRSKSQHSSRTIALALPEILSNVFTYLDQPSLQACFEVSRLWNTCSRRMLWCILSIDLPHFVSFVCDHEDSDDDIETMRQVFFESCHCIRSLVLSRYKGHTIRYRPIPVEKESLCVQIPGLKNLYHLALRWSTFQPMGLLYPSLSLYRLMGAIIAQNPGIRELEWNTGNNVLASEFIDLVLKRTSKDLKKLSIIGDVGVQEFGVLAYLIEAHENRKRRMEQEGQIQKKDSQSQDVQTLDAAQDVEDDDQGCCQLEELVLQDANLSRRYHERAGLKLTWLLQFPGTLPIRSLSLIDYETDQYSTLPNQQPNGSLLAILSKCPHLVELHVTFTVRCETSTHNFLMDLRSNPHFTIPFPGQGPIAERNDFVQTMRQSCPNLREIELGLFYQLKPTHWTPLMTRYASQLTALSLWGNITHFQPKAFFNLIGPPTTHLGRQERVRRLTRLNFNGMEHLHECVWVALYQLPHLQEFRARSVTLNAKALVRPEGWACKGLKVLEISIGIPKEPIMVPTAWHWCTRRRIWIMGQASCCDNHWKEYDWSDEWKEASSDMASQHDRKRKFELVTSRMPDEPQKKFRTEYKRIEEELMPRPAISLATAVNTTATATETTTEIVPFCQGLQILVCKALGRLTQLRELTIEGPMGRTPTGLEYGCLELTLETGLDRLAPLQQNLEKLTVWQLKERLSGRKEVEWIARHWVHHNNPHWLAQHPAVDSAESKETTTTTTTTTTACPPSLTSPLSSLDHHNDLLIPGPKFKELIGISEGHSQGRSAQEMSENIDWLEEQCPSLRVCRIPSSVFSRLSKATPTLNRPR